MDVDAFRAAVPASMATRVLPQQKKGDRMTGRQTAPFLSGPVPVAWLAAANVAGGSALAIGIALWFHRGLRKKYGPILRVNAAVRKAMDLTPDQARRAIATLASKGLIHIHTGGRGRCAEVEILDPLGSAPSVDCRKAAGDEHRAGAGRKPWHETYDRPPATQRDADTASTEMESLSDVQAGTSAEAFAEGGAP